MRSLGAGRRRERRYLGAAALPGAARRRALRCLLAASAAVAACREAPPKAQPEPPSAEAEARALVEQARREVEEGAAATAAVVAAPDAVYVPKTSSNVPLLVFLHGLGGSGATLSSRLALREFAERAEVAFMAPDGAEDYSGRRFWNASPSCCNFSELAVDHVAQLRQWIVDATKRPHIDPKRVYLVGFSNGGFMAYRAACDMGDLIRGIVSIAGAGPNRPSACRPTHKVSVLQIHGDADPIVAFEGGYLFADRSRPKHPSAEASVRPWARFNGCDEKLAPSGALDLDPRIPGGETEVLRHAGCKAGRVELWRIRGGDHSAGLSRQGLEAIWSFIRADSGA